MVQLIVPMGAYLILQTDRPRGRLIAKVSAEMTAKTAQALAPGYCGCCGRPTESTANDWCAKCLPHVITEEQGEENLKLRGLPPWERTWFAQHGTDCPYQELP